VCLRECLLLVPDPRKRAGRWHPPEFVLALAVCAFTAAGHDSPTAIAEWAAGCSRQTLLLLGGRPDPLAGRVRPPSTRTFRRVLARIDADALNQALYAFLEVMPPAAAGELPEVTLHEREQRRAAATVRQSAGPGLLPHAAADGKTARGAVRPDGSQVHLLSAFHVTAGRVMAQREVGAKTKRRRRLRAELRRLRTERGLTIDGVQELSKGDIRTPNLSRWETGERNVRPTDVRLLLDIYEVTGEEREALLTLARQAKERGWWQSYGTSVPSWGVQCRVISARMVTCPGCLFRINASTSDAVIGVESRRKHRFD
jgi:hypothetical protein